MSRPTALPKGLHTKKGQHLLMGRRFVIGRHWPSAVCLLLAALLALTALTGCDLRPLTDPVNVHFLRVYLNEDLANVTGGFYCEDYQHPAYQAPPMVKVLVCDSLTGRVVEERYLRDRGHDEYGNYYQGYVMCDAARYQVLAYSYGSEWTVIQDESNLYQVQATTNPVTMDMSGFMRLRLRLKALAAARAAAQSSGTEGESQASEKGGEPNVLENQSQASGNRGETGTSAPGNGTNTQSGNAQFAPSVKAEQDTVWTNPPEVFFSCREGVEVPYAQHVDSLKPLQAPRFCLTSRVRTYYIQLRLKGLPFVDKVQGMVSGLSGGVRLHDQSPTSEPVSVLFDMYFGKSEGDEVDIYGYFPTFGLPIGWSPAQGLQLTLGITAINGGLVGVEMDIAPDFVTPLAQEKAWILLNRMVTVTLPEPGDPGDGGGGFSPGLNPWQDQQIDVVI